MIDREKNGMARLLQELKKGTRAEVDESRRCADTNSENNERSRDEDEDCTTTHSTSALVSRHCVHTCISSGIPSTRRIIENIFRFQSQLLLRWFSNSEYRVVPCLLVLFHKDSFTSRSVNTTL